MTNETAIEKLAANVIDTRFEDLDPATVEATKYRIIDTLGWVVVIGLISCLFGLLLGLPFFLVKYYRNRG